MPKPRVKIPKKIEQGKPFEVKTLISHKMESGQRTDEQSGELVPRRILTEFVCRLDGAEVFRVKMYPAVSANPFISFFVTAQKSGELEFIWTDDDGTQTKHSVPIEVKA